MVAMRALRKLPPMKKRGGVSEVIAVLLLVVIVLAVVIIVVLFATGVIHSLESGGVATPVTTGGQMVVPGSRGDFAIVTLSLRNSDNQVINAIKVTNSTGFAAGAAATTGTTSSATVNVLTMASATWTMNQYAGDYLEYTSGPAVGQYLMITSNTFDTITTAAGFSPAPTPAGGDTFSVVHIITMDYLNTPIAPAACPCTSLPLEDTAVGSGMVSAAAGSQFIAGGTYTFLLTLTFSSGTQQVVDIEVTAIA